LSNLGDELGGGVSKNNVILPVTHHISETLQDTITVSITNRNSYIRRFDWCKDLQAWLTLKKEWKWFFYLRCGYYRSLFMGLRP